MAGGRSAAVTVNIVADASRAIKGFGDATDAGERFAKGLERVADRVEKSFANTTALADKLAQSLGPEFRTMTGQTITDLARQMDRAGLSAEDLDGNLEAITAQLRRLEAATDDVSTGLGRVTSEADNSRSVMANFTGNAIQELPMMAGAFGPLNMAIGQFAEYAAEGNIKLSGLVKTLGPMAAIGGGVYVVSEIMRGLSANAEFAAENVELFTEAMKSSGSEGTDAIDALVDEWTRLGKIEALVTRNVERSGFSWGKFFNPFSDQKSFDTVVTGVEDITDELANLGLTARQFAQLSLGTTQQLELFRAEMVAAGYSGAELDVILSAVASTQDDAARAAENASLFQRVFGDELAATTTYADRFNNEMQTQKDLVDQLDDSWTRYWDAFNNELARREVWESFGDTDMVLEERLQLLGEYVQTVLGMPPDAMDRLNWTVSTGDLEAAERYLHILEGIADALERPDYWYPWFTGGRPSANVPGPMRGYADGTSSAMPGWALVGEQGPELVRFAGGETVYPANISAMMASGSTAPVVYATINMPSGADGDDVVAALERWTQRNGSLPLPVSSVVR